MIALGAALVARGHEVHLQTWKKWGEDVQREGMTFHEAPEWNLSPAGRDLTHYEAAVQAIAYTEPAVQELSPHAAVTDILTVAGGLTAERQGVPWATLVPHVLPTSEAGLPPYSIGARLPRTRLGSLGWGTMRPLLVRGEERGRDELNEARREAGLVELAHTHGGISRDLALVATFPQLEYPRHERHPSIRVTGPLLWERPFEEVELPPGDDPLVLVAPSTTQDPDGRLLSAALSGLARERVRVIATTNRRPPARPLRVPPNARLVDWLSYARTMPRCAAVVCHAGHGTVARALACGVPVIGCPSAGDMAENAARVAWAGCGVSLPRRFMTPRGVRLAVRRVLADRSYATEAGRLAAWAKRHDGPTIAAQAVEELAGAREAAGVGLEPTT